jgi:hypothetical protein
MSDDSALTFPAHDPAGVHPWADWPDERLLDLRLCDLRLTIEGSWLADRVHALGEELAAKGLGFRPHYWLSDEWFTPTA